MKPIIQTVTIIITLKCVNIISSFKKFSLLFFELGKLWFPKLINPKLSGPSLF